MPNPALVRAFAPLRRELIAPTAPFDPWWWPVGAGQGTAEWGLPLEDSARLRGLHGPSPTTNNPYTGFCGSIGASEGAVMVVSTRPSMGSFPSASCTRLYNALAATGITDAHISDLVKFRGPIDERAVTWEMWEVSRDIMIAELDAIGPSAVLIVPEAMKWIREWQGGGFGRWSEALSPPHKRLLRWLSTTAAEVPFWGGNSRKPQREIKQRWLEGLTEARRRARPWVRRRARGG